MKIAVYTIALNEDKHLERWLAATEQFDYRLILDTGSTDGSWRFYDDLESSGDHKTKVFYAKIEPFRFDDARNTALALLPDDVDLCLSLDMDEVPEPGFYKKLRKVKNADKVRIWHNTGNRWQCDRVHSRHGWRWVSPCHEVTMWYGEGEPRYVDLDADIFHKPDETKSRSNYLPMLEMAVRERPTDGRMWTYLAREYMYHKRTDDLVDAAQQAYIKNPWSPERAAVSRWAGEATEETHWFTQATEVCSGEAENWHALAAHHYRQQRWDVCYDAAQRGLECEPTTHYLRDESVLNWRLFDLLAIAQWNRGLPQDALYWAEKALVNNPDDRRLLQNVEFYRGKVEQTS